MLSRCSLLRPPVMLFLIGILTVPVPFPTVPLLILLKRDSYIGVDAYRCGVGECVSRLFIEMRSIALGRFPPASVEFYALMPASTPVGYTVPMESVDMAPSWLPRMSSASSSTITSLKRWFFFVSVDVFLFVAYDPPVDWSWPFAL